jgi:hypothetical protein
MLILRNFFLGILQNQANPLANKTLLLPALKKKTKYQESVTCISFSLFMYHFKAIMIASPQYLIS